ncbi:EF-hand domain-containing family member C2, partial [Fasciolopsis buskii]
DFTPIKPPRISTQVQVKREIPPYNGWGSEEDSLANCKGLIPVPPKGDFAKFVAMDKQGLDSHILRFTARLISKDPVDQDRLFLISCYLSDETFSIYEPVRRNSGFKGGLFLERGRVKKPSNDRFPVELSDYYKPSDAYVGAVLEFNHFKFELTDADEYTMKYMEDHSTEFPVSDINLILDKLKTFAKTRCDELQQYAINQDPEHTGTFGYRQLQCLIDQLTGPEHALRLHEMHTLGRHYAEKPPKAIQHEYLIGLAQQTLRKAAFENYGAMLQACQQADADRTGEIDPEVLRRICLTQHVPLPNDMLKAIMEYSATQSGKIRYELFLSQLNWRCQTSATATVPCDYTGNLEIDWESASKGDRPVSLGRQFQPQAELIGRVCYKPLFDDLCGTVSGCV